jgi:hypothetical protein
MASPELRLAEFHQHRRFFQGKMYFWISRLTAA